MLTADAVPFPCKDVVSRMEPSGVLLFQVRTDEMYFASKSAYALFALCDGTRTVGEIGDAAAGPATSPEAAADRERVERLLMALADRRLIELWS